MAPHNLPIFESFAKTAAQDWTYLAEGNVSIVFSYTGSSPSLKDNVLRLRKCLVDDSDSVGTTQPTSEDDKLEIEFQNTIVPKLLPPQFLPVLLSIPVSSEWLRELSERTASAPRPASRKIKKIDVTQKSAILTTNVIGTEGLAIEIKPKWAFLPNKRHLSRETCAVKSRRCRYCLHALDLQRQAMAKKKEGSTKANETTNNHALRYCPLDLFSNKEVRMKKALEALWDSWVKTNGAISTFKLFVDGQMVLPSSTEILKEVLPQKSDTSDFRSQITRQALSALLKSSVLQDLYKLQRNLDPLDNEGLFKLFDLYLQAQNQGEGASKHPAREKQGKKAKSERVTFDEHFTQPTLKQWVAFVKEYNKDNGRHGAALAKKCFETDELDPSKLEYFLHAFLLSATFKDCSIIIRPSTGKIMIIDTEPKQIKRIEKWRKQNQDMVNGYEEDGSKCVDEHLT